MTNLDLKKEWKHLYKPSSKQIGVVNVPTMHYLQFDGEGNPGTSPSYVAAVQALYGLAYGIRALSKAAGLPFTVMPLEGLWTIPEATDVRLHLSEEDKNNFIWTMMIVQPNHVTPEMVTQAREQVARKKPELALEKVRFESYHEGEAVQIMYVGPYDQEGPTIVSLHEHIAASGWHASGRHHEIYLNDPRRVAPKKLKTIIRQPFTR